MIEKEKKRITAFFSNSVLYVLIDKIRSKLEELQIRQVEENLSADEKLKYLYKAIKEEKISYRDAQMILKRNPLTTTEITKIIHEISSISHLIWSDIPASGFEFSLHESSQPILSSNSLLEYKQLYLGMNASIFLHLQILYQLGVFRILKNNNYLSGIKMLPYGKTDSFEQSIKGYGVYVIKTYLDFIHDEHLDQLWCHFQKEHPIDAQWQCAFEVFLKMQRYAGGAENLMQTVTGDRELFNQFAGVTD